MHNLPCYQNNGLSRTRTLWGINSPFTWICLDHFTLVFTSKFKPEVRNAKPLWFILLSTPCVTVLYFIVFVLLKEMY